MMSTIRVKFAKTNCKKMEGKRKNYLSYFWHIALWIHTNFEFGDSLDVEFQNFEFRDSLDAELNYASNT